METKTPQIWISCLSAYNNGFLHGAWIDANQEPEKLQEEVNRILSTSPVKGWECCEEWAIHDYDDMVNLGEYASLEDVSEVAKAIAECGEAYEAYIDHVGSEFATIAGFRDCYCGEHDSERAFVEERFSEENEIPNHLACYIDYEKVATDWFIGDYYFNRGHVFRRV